MAVEIETKLKVDSLKEIEARLTKLGAEFIAEQIQTDYYLDDAGSQMTKSDSCLRLRSQRTAEGQDVDITFKGPKDKSRFKKRREIILKITDTDTALELFAAIGYKKSLVIQKKRLLWRFAGCEVALDELPLLGNFVEIEASDEDTIAEVQQQLDLSHLHHIKESYAGLIENRLNELNVSKKEIYLETS